MLRYRDNFAMLTPPETWALAFRQAVEDAMTRNAGPDLRQAVTRLMMHPMFRDAHGTDEHFLPCAFVAGAAGDWEDRGVFDKLMAEDWELVRLTLSPQLPFRSRRPEPINYQALRFQVNMCNSQ